MIAENEFHRERSKEKSGSPKISRQDAQKWMEVLPFGSRQVSSVKSFFNRILIMAEICLVSQ